MPIIKKFKIATLLLKKLPAVDKGQTIIIKDAKNPDAGDI
tara:strand:+ start:367 stop:486 length:120 start_codon:yes stop_codon:yes gene_type:complete